MTDGEIHDMEATIEQIYEMSLLPISIVVVGVGNEEFENMQKLDGDEGIYTSRGQKVPRDIVQFVPYKKFKNSPADLSREVLAEIPDQLVGYMAMNGIKPAKPQSIDVSQLVPRTQQVIAGNQGLMNFGTQIVGGLLNQNQNQQQAPMNLVPNGFPPQQQAGGLGYNTNQPIVGNPGLMNFGTQFVGGLLNQNQNQQQAPINLAPSGFPTQQQAGAGFDYNTNQQMSTSQQQPSSMSYQQPMGQQHPMSMSQQQPTLNVNFDQYKPK